MHSSYSLVFKTIKIKNTAFFNSRSMWFMSVASKEVHKSFSAAKLFCCTITLLLKNFTDYHHIYSLWALNASLRQVKTQVFERIKRSSPLSSKSSFLKTGGPFEWTKYGQGMQCRHMCTAPHPIIHVLVRVLLEHSLKEDCQFLN